MRVWCESVLLLSTHVGLNIMLLKSLDAASRDESLIINGLLRSFSSLGELNLNRPIQVFLLLVASLHFHARLIPRFLRLIHRVSIIRRTLPHPSL
jgi:hypothetical protein